MVTKQLNFRETKTPKDGFHYVFIMLISNVDSLFLKWVKIIFHN